MLGATGSTGIEGSQPCRGHKRNLSAVACTPSKAYNRSYLFKPQRYKNGRDQALLRRLCKGRFCIRHWPYPSRHWEEWQERLPEPKGIVMPSTLNYAIAVAIEAGDLGGAAQLIGQCDEHDQDGWLEYTEEEAISPLAAFGSANWIG